MRLSLTRPHHNGLVRAVTRDIQAISFRTTVHFVLLEPLQMSLQYGNTDLLWYEQAIMVEEDENNKGVN